MFMSDLPAWKCTIYMPLPWRLEESILPLELKFGPSERPCVCWETNLGSLEEQTVLLTAETAPQSHCFNFHVICTYRFYVLM